MGETSGEDDATLVRKIAETKDEFALAELMERHAPKVTGDLRHRFRHQLQHPEIDQAVNNAAMKVWKNAHTFNGKQPFGPWFQSIAHRAALDILKGEKKQPTSGLEFDLIAPVSADLEETENSPRTTWHMEQLEQIIDFELKGFEQTVARADVAAGGPKEADTELLMKQHNKKKNVVQATRSKVWKKIRERIHERKALLDHTEVNP
ncbi:RNA polymerase sigma factor [Zavarzinella formosa]|uniref:RNA polymerase sigma factor n=1 Tax=Zavarzinella formosa TaxID=360055 RepID=UPI00036160BE|nr:sigma factor [Zavarzinella formosa]